MKLENETGRRRKRRSREEVKRLVDEFEASSQMPLQCAQRQAPASTKRHPVRTFHLLAQRACEVFDRRRQFGRYLKGLTTPNVKNAELRIFSVWCSEAFNHSWD